MFHIHWHKRSRFDDERDKLVCRCGHTKIVKGKRENREG